MPADGFDAAFGSKVQTMPAHSAPPLPRVVGARTLGIALALLLPALVALGVRHGETDAIPDLGSALQGALAAIGVGSPIEPAGSQLIASLRLWRALTAAGVGAALGLSGALVQGLFRNDLASPGILGISGGASLGAVFAVLLVGGYGPNLVLEGSASPSGLVLIPAAAFAGALAVAALVWRLAATRGVVSVPALLLIGIAMNTFVGGVQQLVQSLMLGDWEVSRSILSWTFGTLDDRSAWHAVTAFGGLALALAAIPFVAWELDLMRAGLEDAEALGVNTRRVRWIALAAAALAASAAVAVAGQIAFVGLVVPHLARLLSGTSHRTLLPLSALVGAAFLLATDLAQTLLLPDAPLQPGVTMSLLGGPFFVLLVWRRRREVGVW